MGCTLQKTTYDSDMYNREFPGGNFLFFYMKEAWTPPKRRASMLLAVSEWRRLRNQ